MFPLPESASPDALAAIEALWQQLGFVPLLLQGFGGMPRAIGAQASLAHVLVVAPGALPRETRMEILRVAAAPDRPGSLSGRAPRDAAMLECARTLARDPAAVDAAQVAELRSAGLGDEQILEAVLATGLGRLLATLAAGLGSRSASPPIPMAPAAVALQAPQLAAPELSPSDFAPFAVLQKAFGFVPRLYRAQTSKPEAIEAEVVVLREVLLAEQNLSRVQKERILHAVSAANRNEYGVALHGRVLQLLGAPADAGLSDADRPSSRGRVAWRIAPRLSEKTTGNACELADSTILRFSRPSP